MCPSWGGFGDNSSLGVTLDSTVDIKLRGDDHVPVLWVIYKKSNPCGMGGSVIEFSPWVHETLAEKTPRQSTLQLPLLYSPSPGSFLALSGAETVRASHKILQSPETTKGEEGIMK